jgi:large subunit ribosomal protein L32e
MAIKFLRRTWNKYSKLGRKRKKKQVWRKPTGRDNKMREKQKGKPPIVSIGYGSANKKRVFVVQNFSDLLNIPKEKIIVLGKIGKKKKIEICKKAKEKGIEFSNVNIKKYLKKNTPAEDVENKK